MISEKGNDFYLSVFIFFLNFIICYFTVSDATKQVVLVVSLLLLTFALLTSGLALVLWLQSRVKEPELGKYSKLNTSEKADLACDEDALRGIC